MKVPDFVTSLQSPDLNIAVASILKAGKLFEERNGNGLQDFARNRGPMRVQEKKPGDYVTELDAAMESAIVSLLTSHGAAMNEILSEESFSDTEWGKPDYWIIDPLDATSAYIFQSSAVHPSIMIARQQNYRLTSAAIYFPLTRELFYAEHDSGAWYSQCAVGGGFTQEKRLKVEEPVTILEKAWIVLNRQASIIEESSSFRRLELALRRPPLVGLLSCEVPHSGIACRVASGKVAAVIHDNSTSSKKQAPWDIAAPLLIAQEAGCVSRTLHGAIVDIWQHDPFLIAQSEALANAILEKCNASIPLDQL